MIPSKSAPSAPPDVSVLIPTLNGGRELARCLDAICDQNSNLAAEIVCVDSGSSSADLKVMEQHGARIVRIDPTRFNHGLTRDLAARNSAGRTLVFLDQGAFPANDQWLRRLTKPLSSGNRALAAVQGGILEDSDATKSFYWSSCGGRCNFTRETGRWLQAYGIEFSTVNCAISRAVWDKHPFGWAPVMADKKWQREVMDVGFKIEDRLDAAVIHTLDFDLRSLIRHCRDEGFGWRTLDIHYSLWDAARDMLKPGVYFTLLKGLVRGRVRTSAELLFPWVRPLNLWLGNHHARSLSL